MGAGRLIAVTAPMTVGVGELAEWLVEHGITTAVMESTGVYWKPIYLGLEGTVAELSLPEPARSRGWRRSQRAVPTHPSPRRSGSRVDVLVEVEQVLGVVGALDVDQPPVVAAVVVLDTSLIVVGHEVDVAARLGVR